MNEFWQPPFCLHRANYGLASNKSYYNDVSTQGGPKRILIKHTLSGTGALYARGKRFVLKPGMIFVIERPGPYVYCYEDGPEPWTFEYISISFTNPGGLLPKNLLENPVMSLEGHDDLKAQISKLVKIRAHQGNSYKAELLHSALAYQLFLSYIAVRSEDMPQKNKSARDLKNMLDGHFAEDISIKEYARANKCTQEGLTRAFVRAYGTSPGQYLQSLRVRKACELLADGKCNIKEAAFESGFSSQNYFGRVFKKHMGVSPGRFIMLDAGQKSKGGMG